MKTMPLILRIITFIEELDKSLMIFIKIEKPFIFFIKIWNGSI